MGQSGRQTKLNNSVSRISEKKEISNYLPLSLVGALSRGDATFIVVVVMKVDRKLKCSALSPSEQRHFKIISKNRVRLIITIS